MTLVKATMSQDCNVLKLVHILADYLDHLYQTNPKNFPYLFLDFLGPSVHFLYFSVSHLAFVYITQRKPIFKTNIVRSMK
jgi:hypothetical protein